jgi:hypothetical protein
MQRKMRAQRDTSERNSLIEAAIKMGTEQVDINVGNDEFQRTYVQFELADLLGRRLTGHKRAMISGTMMLFTVVIALGVLGRVVMLMRVAGTCFRPGRRFRTAIDLTRMRMMSATAKGHVDQQQKYGDLWQVESHAKLQARKPRPRNN